MHVAAVDLARPASADLDFTVARGSPVADHEMVGQPVGHVAHVQVIVIEGQQPWRVPLLWTTM